MKPSLASAWTSSLIVVATVSGEPMNDCRPVTSMISSRIDRFSASALRPPLVRPARPGPWYNCRTLARPLEISVLADHRVEVGQRAVDVVAGQVGFHSCSRNLIAVCGADLLAADLVGDLGRLGVGVAEHERGRGQDQQLVRGSGRTWPAGP
jgi:hypothetical protein